ncbi:MAG: phosphotransferase [Clostridia bacterium]|nr:phosphotransferase [Clostridia bacterium]
MEELIKECNLGTTIKSIVKITGGLSHRMYKVVTDKGTYAIKELNSGIMKKDTAYSNFLFAEKFTDLAKANGIPAIGTIKIGNDIMKKIDNKYYMIFEWIEGTILKSEDIEEKHSEIVGKLLAKIHNIDSSSIDDDNRKHINTKMYDWNEYISIVSEQNKPYFQLYKDNIDLLYDLNKKSKEAIEYANNNLVISHRDLDRKNIMWQGDNPYIIDWEASGYINPTLELIQVAWYWSGGDIEKIDYNKFEKVIKSYKENYNGYIDSNIDVLIHADIYSGLEWIDYNLRRSLCIGHDYDEEEVHLAENEVIQSINEIKYNVSQFNKMTEILKKVD